MMRINSWTSGLPVGYTIIISKSANLSMVHDHLSKSVFRSATGNSTQPNTIHPVHNTTGRNSTEMSTKFPSLCCGHTAVHGFEAKQCGIITPKQTKLCHWHQVLGEGQHVTTKNGQNRDFITDEKSFRNLTINKIKIDLINISTESSVINLGAIFDSALSSEAFVNSICKSAWFNSFNISRSRRSLTTDAAKILIQAYVMSKIDYCNSLLYGIPDKLLNRI